MTCSICGAPLTGFGQVITDIKVLNTISTKYLKGLSETTKKYEDLLTPEDYQKYKKYILNLNIKWLRNVLLVQDVVDKNGVGVKITPVEVIDGKYSIYDAFPKKLLPNERLIHKDCLLLLDKTYNMNIALNYRNHSLESQRRNCC